MVYLFNKTKMFLLFYDNMVYKGNKGAVGNDDSRFNKVKMVSKVLLVLLLNIFNMVIHTTWFS